MATQSTTESNERNKNIILPSQLNLKSASITVPKKKKEKLVSYLLHNSSVIYVESPWLRAPFGVSGYQQKPSDPKEWSLNLSSVSQDDPNSVNEYEDKKAVSDWFQQWTYLDEMMIDHGIKNSKVIFNKEYKESQREVVKALFSPCAKVKEGYPLSIKLKIQKKRDPKDLSKQLESPNLVVYFENETEPTTVESFEDLEKIVPKNGYVKAIFQPKTWYIAGKIGLSLTLLQLLVKKRSGGRPTGYAFSVQSTPLPKQVEAAESAFKNLALNQQDSDGEQPDDANEEVEEDGGNDEVEDV